MADVIVIGKPCAKCGSIERRQNGQCVPCSRAASIAWKVRNEARIAASGEPRFYTYIHRRADDGKVFYVGKGRGYRAMSRVRNQHWQRTAKKHGILIEIVERWESESEAFDHEKLLIARYRNEQHPLCNYTDGGDGPSGFKHSAETRAKLSAMQVGKKLSAEHRAKLSAIARKGIPRTAEVREKISRANKGRKRTPDQIKRNSEARRGKRQSAQTIAKRAAKLIGRPRSEETRAKISASRMGIKPSAHCIAMVKAANTGIVRSAEFKAKIVAALTGRPCSAETRKKISEAQTGKVITKEQRYKISKTLTGRKQPESVRAKVAAIVRSPEWRARHSATMKARFAATREAQMTRK